MTDAPQSRVVHESAGGRGRFVIRDDQRIVAYMSYSLAGDTTMIVDHTEVDASVKGRGVGMELMRSMVQHARDNGLKVMATCPFALAMFGRHSELRDVYRGP